MKQALSHQNQVSYCFSFLIVEIQSEPVNYCLHYYKLPGKKRGAQQGKMKKETALLRAWATARKTHTFEEAMEEEQIRGLVPSDFLIQC